jgi:hypothetical protein
MSKKMQLMEVVLPRLARRLYGHLQRYKSGELDDAAFAAKFETVLQKQYDWLASNGVPEAQAAVAIHGAVLVLSGPGLRAEAEASGTPLEVIEQRAIAAAARDVSQNYDLTEQQAAQQIATIVARYGD